MSRECWSHLKSNLKNCNKQSGIYLLICLIFFYSSPLASLTIKVEHIHQLAQSYQGEQKKRFIAWEQLIIRLHNRPVDEQLTEVNLFFNLFPYQSDLESHKVDDYWKSPEEFLSDGGGDCEDYAIIKYFTLVTLGVPKKRLRITYVTSLKLKQAHMILSYYPSPEAEPLILDNLESKILTASKRPDLNPVYSFNGDGLWLAKQQGSDHFMGQPGTLNKWDELMQRMQ